MTEINTAVLEDIAKNEEDERSEAFRSVLDMHAKFYREFNSEVGENRFNLPFGRDRIDRYVYDLIRRIVKNIWKDDKMEKEFIDYYNRVKKEPEH